MASTKDGGIGACQKMRKKEIVPILTGKVEKCWKYF